MPELPFWVVPVLPLALGAEAALLFVCEAAPAPLAVWDPERVALCPRSGDAVPWLGLGGILGGPLDGVLDGGLDGGPGDAGGASAALGSASSKAAKGSEAVACGVAGACGHCGEPSENAALTSDAKLGTANSYCQGDATVALQPPGQQARVANKGDSMG